MGRYTKPLKKENVIQKVLDFLDNHNHNPGDRWTPVTQEDWNTLSEVFCDIIACKWERDCDGSLPIDFEICNRNNRHFLPFCTLPYNNKDPKRSRVSALADLQEYVAKELAQSIRLSMRHLVKKE